MNILSKNITLFPLSFMAHMRTEQNNLNSDFDALVISYDHEQFHDTSFVNDIQLDVFVYPASYFDGEFDCNNFIQILMERLLWITRNEEKHSK